MKKVRGREAAEPSSSVQHHKAHKKVENVNEIAEACAPRAQWNVAAGACVARTKGMKSSGGFETSDGKRAQVQRFGDKGGIAQVEGYSAQLKTKENAEGRHALLMADGKHELDNGERVDERNERHRMRSAQRPFRLWTEPGGARQKARARTLSVCKERTRAYLTGAHALRVCTASTTGKWWSGGAPSKAFLMGVLLCIVCEWAKTVTTPMMSNTTTTSTVTRTASDRRDDDEGGGRRASLAPKSREPVIRVGAKPVARAVYLENAVLYS
ncbi:hypothetical protein niasHT_020128 [Heterodera trifolii]|uniref:Uncharacterized protein n=1 Tax=Heterodera trifolii TaxID=157864 RepID=A0ABD2LJQ1_9BILA